MHEFDPTPRLAALGAEAARTSARHLADALKVAVEMGPCRVELVDRQQVIDRLRKTIAMTAVVLTRVTGTVGAANLVMVSHEGAIGLVAEAIGSRADRPVLLSAFTPLNVLKRVGATFCASYTERFTTLELRMHAPDVWLSAGSAVSLAESYLPTEPKVYEIGARFQLVRHPLRPRGTQAFIVGERAIEKLFTGLRTGA